MISLEHIAKLYNNPLASDFTVTDGESSIFLHRAILSCNPYFQTYFTTPIGVDKTKMVLSKERFRNAQWLLKVIYDPNFCSENANDYDYLEMLKQADQWFIPADKKMYIVAQLKNHLSIYTHRLAELLQVAAEYTWIPFLVTFVLEHLDEFGEDMMESGIRSHFTPEQIIRVCIHFKNLKWITPEIGNHLGDLFDEMVENPDPSFYGIGCDHFMTWESATTIVWRDRFRNDWSGTDFLIIDSLVPYKAEYIIQCNCPDDTIKPGPEGILMNLYQTVCVGDTIRVGSQHYPVKKMYYVCGDQITPISKAHPGVECILDIGLTEVDPTTILYLAEMQN